MTYLQHLAKDKKLARILPDLPLVLVRRKNTGIRLIQSIISQQLSTRVAEVIFGRFLALYEGKEPSLQKVLDTPDESLRAIGLSAAKLGYIKNVAAFFLAHKISDAYLQKQTDADIIAQLTQIKGVGKWTVEMLLMFSLGREDVFAVDDLGIQQAMCKLYKIDSANKKAMQTKMLTLAQRWVPYRSYACRHLWAWKDNP
jgi:DNA-3-methyladenine glycosylase II